MQDTGCKTNEKERPMKEKKSQVPEPMEAQPLPADEPPEVTTYTDEEILEEMGPAQAVTGIVDP
jgi:hypothetical protein